MTDVQAILRASHARFFIPDAAGGYFAEIPDFPGCFAEGLTLSEAAQNLERAAVSWVEAALAQGIKIPDPDLPFESRPITIKAGNLLICTQLPGLHEMASAGAVVVVGVDGEMKLVKNSYGPRSDNLLLDYNTAMSRKES